MVTLKKFHDKLNQCFMGTDKVEWNMELFGDSIFIITTRPERNIYSCYTWYIYI